MKRTILAAALCVAPTSPALAGDSAIPAAAGANAVAFDQVDFPAKTLKRFAFYHGMTRVESVALHNVAITKLGEVDVLDTQK